MAYSLGHTQDGNTIIIYTPRMHLHGLKRDCGFGIFSVVPAQQSGRQVANDFLTEE